MPKPGTRHAPAVINQIRAIFKKVVDNNRMIAAEVEPKVRASTIRPRDKARAVIVARMLKDNKVLRVAIRGELKKIGVKPKRKRRGT